MGEVTLCKRCGEPVVAGDECEWVARGCWEWADVALACRDRELENTQRALASARAQLAHARVLLLRVKEALDVAIEETEPEEADGG